MALDIFKANLISYVGYEPFVFMLFNNEIFEKIYSARQI